MSSACLTIDVLGLGAVTIDDLIYVESYPPADAKVAVLRSQRQCGGLTGTALVAASRLGAKCAYAGVLGTDELSRFVIQCLENEGIDLRHTLRQPDAKPIHAVIVVDETKHTRNVFVNLNETVGAGDEWPREEVILSTRVLLVDHIGVRGMLRAADLCRRAGIPVVADFERIPGPEFDRLLECVDHLILSQAFAEKLTGEKKPAVAARSLFNSSRQVVALTCGRDGCWYMAQETSCQVHHHAAYSVHAVDTTGCGDVFHGAYASALAKGMPLHERISLASAAAALKATCPGGQAGIPTHAAVEVFLKKQPCLTVRS